MKVLRNSELFRTACYFAAIMCLLSILPIPMLSFVRVVRYATLAVAAWGIVVALCQKSTLSVLALGVAVVLLNPFVPVITDVSAMRMAAVVAAIVFFASAVRLDPRCLPESLTPSDHSEPAEP